MSTKTVPLDFHELPLPEMQKRAVQFHELMANRRTVRDFSGRAVPQGIIEDCISAAITAPSGANLQPWHFVVVSDPDLKKEIRTAAEKEEQEFYENRAPEQWLDALEPLGTNSQKPFLETVPYVIAIFAESYSISDKAGKQKNYYVKESVGIATGILITALHNAGLATLTHTPSPMGFLNHILHRPKNEKPFLLLVAGYPAENVQVPDIPRKSFGEVVTIL